MNVYIRRLSNLFCYVEGNRLPKAGLNYENWACHSYPDIYADRIMDGTVRLQ